MSASITPTSVTLGKSSPLAIICVPSRMSTSPRPTRSSISVCAHFPVVVSTSMRDTRAEGKRSLSSRSTCWVPTPRCFMFSAPHSRHVAESASVCWQ